MVGDRSTRDTNPCLLPKFLFHVRWGSEVLLFQEVSGLASQSQAIVSNLTLKKGIFNGEPELWDQIKTRAVDGIPITISLLDEAATPVMMWTFSKAWPTKVTAPVLNAEGNEIAIEVIELTCEGLSIGDASSKCDA
jgi:hypothetical protein